MLFPASQVSFKEQGEAKISALSTEVARLRDNRIQLHQKMAKEQRGHKEKTGALQKEISNLKKAEMQGKCLAPPPPDDFEGQNAFFLPLTLMLFLYIWGFIWGFF